MRVSVLAMTLAWAVVLTSPASVMATEADKRMVVLGVDGMDPTLLHRYMDEGVMPNLSRLASLGEFTPLGTSIPPQSPVAWSDFITGMDPGGHGLFDFLALDRETMLPYLSIARVEKPARKPLSIGRWRIPLAAENTALLRDGQAFWEVLDGAGVPVTMFRVPANYPPIRTENGRSLAGMGTPDLRGSPGTFSYYTNDPEMEPGPISGGEIYKIALQNNSVHTVIEGPPNAFLEKSPPATADLEMHVDPRNPVALVRLGEERVLLKVGEWSDWVRVHFELIPGLMSVSGMVRLFLQQTSPHLALYVSPVNIDPRDPAQPIASPAEYAFELAEAVGPFYTQEMPEDTKALMARVLNPRQFLAQSQLVLEERRQLLEHELRRFQEAQRRGLLFFYVISIDQRHHMLARQTDPTHPNHEPDTPADLANAMRRAYREIDEMVGWVMETIAEDTALVVMSDHGFAPFRRQVNLNTWLERQGYLHLKDPGRRQDEWLRGIDWSRTRAFAIGLNSLYLNVRGRERFGVVPPAERAALAREIAAKLASWKDEKTGEFVVSQPMVREDVYHGPHVERAPDVIVGYSRGYRASWATTTGKAPVTLVEDNREEWSGDHCMDSRTVPGVLLTNWPLEIAPADPAEIGLRDLPVSILRYFGVQSPPQMRGRAIF